MEDLTTIVSASECSYQHWQVEMLWETFCSVKQPGNFLALIAKNPKNKLNFSCPTFDAISFSPHPQTRDDYAPYNKPSSICQWLSSENNYDGTLLVLDPDCVFVESLVLKPTPKNSFSDVIWYMNTETDVAKYVIKKFCRKNASLVAPATIPIFIRKYDLAEMAPRWLELTESIRQDEESKKKTGWVAEMWAYNIAAAEFEIKQHASQLACFPNDEKLKSIIHYCYESKSKISTWDKRYHKPYEETGFDEEGAREPAKKLNDLLNLIGAKSYREKYWNHIN